MVPVYFTAERCGMVTFRLLAVQPTVTIELSNCEFDLCWNNFVTSGYYCNIGYHCCYIIDRIL